MQATLFSFQQRAAESSYLVYVAAVVEYEYMIWNVNQALQADSMG